MKIQVLLIGADDKPGGVTSYVNCLATYCDPRRFEFHSTVSERSSAVPSLHSSIKKHLVPGSYSAWTLLFRALQVRKILKTENISVLHLHTARAGLLGWSLLQSTADAGLPSRTAAERRCRGEWPGSPPRSGAWSGRARSCGRPGHPLVRRHR